jgi:glutathione peroxidase
MKNTNRLYVLTFILLLGSIVNAQSFYDYTVVDIDGNNYPLEQLRGNKIMVVNVASKCGFTPQYEQLEELYTQYKDSNFIIIGFPANNFKEQEPGTNEEIKEFCSLNYGVTFPIMAKISVKGDSIAPIYQWLTQKELNGFDDSSVKWNFQKYLIGEDGTLEHVINPWVKPDNKKIVDWIEEK